MFEHSEANRRLFELEPIVSFAEALVAENCHVIHNNSFQTFPGGGITSWHQDDAPHYIVYRGRAAKEHPIASPTLYSELLSHRCHRD